MKKCNFLAGVLGIVMMAGTVDSHAEKWVKNKTEPSKNIEAVFYDADSVKACDKKVCWTEKYVLTGNGSKDNTDGLLKYEACKKRITTKGQVAYVLMDFEMASAQYRTVAARNYNKANELICSDTEMGIEQDKSWINIIYGSPMFEMFYKFVTEFNMGNILE